MDYKASPHLIEIFDFDILHMELNTPLYILVLVLVVMFFMNKLLFQPVLRTLENRAALMRSLRDDTAGHREEIARLSEDYQANLARIRAEVAQVRQEGHREARGAVDAILDEARTRAQAEFQGALRDLERQVGRAGAELSQSSQRLAEQVTNRIIGA